MPINEPNGAAAVQADAVDLGPLAWVLDEVRKSLDVGNKALRKFVRDSDAARGTDLASVDASQLRIARQQLHQAVGALEMVGLEIPAQFLRAMEQAVQRYIQRPEQCTDSNVGVVERAGFALVEYLELLLAGRQPSSVGLFPQYRDVQSQNHADRIHPADLWSVEWRWRSIDGVTLGERELPARRELDQAVLNLIQSGDVNSALRLHSACLAVAAQGGDRHLAVLWTVAAGCFEAMGKGLVRLDVYTKRMASRMLLQFASFIQGDRSSPERLAKDLAFFCSQALPALPGEAPVLMAVRRSLGLEAYQPVDYDVPVYGRYDPSLLTQARKRIEAVKEAWSAVSGGDLTRLKNLGDQFSLMGDSIARLVEGGDRLAGVLRQMAEQTVRSGAAPAAPLALEVATAILYLEASLAERRLEGAETAARIDTLAYRLEWVGGGGESQPLESWMEDLYRSVNDRQTMGTVVGELRTTLSLAEKAMDQFFRNPADRQSIAEVPAYLGQMRGVLSVLGLDQAVTAVARMRDTVERAIQVDIAGGDDTGDFERLGNNLGALGFLIDMLNYQPALARKLFVFDADAGELKPVMGRSVQSSGLDLEFAGDAAPEPTSETAQQAPAASLDLDFLVPEVATAIVPAPVVESAPEVDLSGVFAVDQSVSVVASQGDGGALSARVDDVLESVPVAVTLPQPPAPVSSAVDSGDEVDDELLQIFLEEAGEVISGGRDALAGLRDLPSDLEMQTTLRRAFHTLKGSSRMVGLTEFGEAAWSMEQVLNAWLAENKPVTRELGTLCEQAFDVFSEWADDIAMARPTGWTPMPVRVAADAMRLSGQLLPIHKAEAAEAVAAPAFLVGDTPGGDGYTEPEGQELPAVARDYGADLAVEPASSLVIEVPPVDVTFVVEEQVAAATEGASEMIDVFGDVPAVGETFEVPADSGDYVPGEFVDVSESSSAPSSVDQIEAMEMEWPEGQLDGVAPPALALTSEQASPQVAPTPVEAVDSWDALAFADAATGDGLEPVEESVKVIGDLRVSIPLYNVFLNEADEWSRCLENALNEWALAPDVPIPESAEAWAHSLAGSSGTVGFLSLSAVARATEHAIQRLRLQDRGTAQQGAVLRHAAEEIRRLLHQFAAGFLREAPAGLEDLLQALEPVDADEAPTKDEFLLSPEDLAAESSGSSELAELEVTPPQASLDDSVWQAPAALTFAAAASVSTVYEAAESDLDSTDTLDPDLFPVFEDEALELLPQLGGAMRQWVERPENLSARAQVLRVLHTLKGSSRLAGAMRLGELTHRLESEIESLGSEPVNTAQIAPLMGRVDEIEAVFERLRQSSQDHGALPISAIAAPGAPSVVESVLPASDELAVLVEPIAVGEAPIPPSSPAAEPIQRGVVAQPAALILAGTRAGAQQAVRVRAQVLDRLVNQAGEVMISRSRVESELSQLRAAMLDLTGNLDRLRQQLRDIELQAETQMQSRLAQAKDSQLNFDPLEFDRFTRVQELTRMMAESVNDVATVQRTIQKAVDATQDDLVAQSRQTRELQRDLLRTRMVEFESISERLYRVVRQAAKDTGKQVKLDIVGGSIEMDRGILDRMTAAFEHLLRNCVVHGIEHADQRSRSGKEPIGVITIELNQAGNDVSVEFRDDGAGLDLVQIRRKAQEKGLLTGEISDSDAANLIFSAGFSTATEVTELAGRGIGMDVVRTEVQGLGGRIETQTNSGQGTSFKLIMPLTTAVTQVVMIRSGGLTFGVPANLVEIVLRLSAPELESAYLHGSMAVGGEPVPFFWSGALLQSSGASADPVGRTTPTVVFRSADQRVAVHVDEVLGNQEVVVKNLGPQLARIGGLTGMTMLASGAVVLIYNPVALAAIYGAQAREWSVRARSEGAQQSAATTSGAAVARLEAIAPQIPLVLVVDDSITVRRVTQRLLQREGYRVSMAADGLQALERLQEERPSVVLSDIEMPRMDGFDLVRNIRADERLRDLPVIMITSRIAEKHREHAKELGVDHYLGKPYAEDELLALIQRYTAVAATA